MSDITVREILACYYGCAIMEDGTPTPIAVAGIIDLGKKLGIPDKECVEFFKKLHDEMISINDHNLDELIKEKVNQN